VPFRALQTSRKCEVGKQHVQLLYPFGHWQ
jgi:hypothetical protein